jgi:hypothetical protein
MYTRRDARQRIPARRPVGAACVRTTALWATALRGERSAAKHRGIGLTALAPPRLPKSGTPRRYLYLPDSASGLSVLSPSPVATFRC